MTRHVFACALACLLLACGESSGGDADQMGAATGRQSAAGASGAQAAGMAGAAGAAMPTAGRPSAGTGGSGDSSVQPPSAGTGSMAGAGGVAGNEVTAGDSGGAGSAGSVAEAGAGGSAGNAGAGPAPSGPDPTTESASRAGPLNVETISPLEFRNGPSFAGGTIWYPTDGEPPYPFVAVVPGFVSYESSIRSWGPFLASHGIVTITIDTNTPADQPPTRAAALLDALESVAAENDRSGSPLMGKLDESRQALMGWSMGGGGALIAANRTPSLKAAISMCGWNPLGSYSMMTVPSLMFASLGDPLAGGQSQGFYRSIPQTTPKMLIEAGAADHFVANNPAYLNGMIGRYGLSWMKVFLVGDERYRQFLLQMPSGTTDYQSNVE